MGLENKPNPSPLRLKASHFQLHVSAARPPVSSPRAGAVSAPGPSHLSSLHALPLRSAGPPLLAVQAPLLHAVSPQGHEAPWPSLLPSLLHLLLTSRVWSTDAAAPRFASCPSLPGQPELRRSPTVLTPQTRHRRTWGQSGSCSDF